MRTNSKDCRLHYFVSLKFLLISLSLVVDPSMFFIISIHWKKIGKTHEPNSQIHEQPLTKNGDTLSVLPRLLHD